MELRQTEVAILGAGLAGLSLALSLSQAGIHTTLLDLKRPDLHFLEDSWDSRTVALNPASMDFLVGLGAWQNLDRSILGRMEAMEIGEEGNHAALHFNASSIGLPLLAQVVENRRLLRALWELIKNATSLDCLAPVAVKAVNLEGGATKLSLDTGEELSAQCLIGADGRHSWLRQQTHQTVTQYDYQQQALVAIVRSEKPHERTARQLFLRTGPLGLLPLGDSHSWSLVWSCDEGYAEKLKAMTSTQFCRTLSNVLNRSLGSFEMLTSVTAIPLHMQHLCHYVAPRLAFIGDAAHSIHPLAGQGINLGFADVMSLSKHFISAKKQRKDLGTLKVLRQFERERRHQNQHMIDAMRFFKEGFSESSLVATQARAISLKILDHSDWFKKLCICYASG